MKIIKAKYQDIQNAFQCLDGLHGDIKYVFENIKKMREINAKLREKYKTHILKLLHLKRKQKVLHKTTELLEIMKIINQASPAITQLLQAGNPATAIEIIENTEKLIAERLISINTALYFSTEKMYHRQIKSKLTLYRQKIQENLRAELSHTLQDFLSLKISPKSTPDSSPNLVNCEGIILQFENERDDAKTAIQTILSKWNINLNDSAEILNLANNIEYQIETLLKIDDPMQVTKIINNFFVSALGQSFIDLQNFLYPNNNTPLSEKSFELTKLSEISAAFLLVYLNYIILYGLAQNTIQFFAKGLTQVNLNIENKRIGEECKGWDDELLSKINTFYASKFEKMLKGIKVSGLTISEYYQIVSFLKEIIRLVTKEMDVSGTILKSCLDDIHKIYLSTYSLTKMEILLKELDSDRWVAVPVPKLYEKIIEFLHTPSLKDIPEISKDEALLSAERLVSDEIPYWTVNSILTLLNIIYEYTKMIQNLPTISYECSTKLLEVIKIYNTKSSHLVLGAGAVQLSKMKNITAKHLAMSSQALSLLLSELPHIKGRIELFLTEKSKSFLEDDFGSIKKDLYKHREDIYKKLSSLLSSRGCELLESAKKIEYTGSQNNEKPAEFATGISTVLQQMYNALAKLLPPEHIGLIFQEAFTEIATTLEVTYPNIKINGVESAKQLIRDLKEIENSITELNLGESSKSIKSRISSIIDQLTQNYH